MTQLITPADRIVGEIRAHLERRGHSHRRWDLYSPANLENHVTVVASRDRASGRGPSRYAAALHLSFMAHDPSGRHHAITEVDLEYWSRQILGDFTRWAHVQRPCQPGEPRYVSRLSTVTTHVIVHLDRMQHPLLPDGPAAVTPWAAA